MVTRCLNNDGIWKEWRAGWKIVLKRQRKYRRLAVLPACESNFSRGYSAANYWASVAAARFASVALPAAAQRFRYSDGSTVLIAQDVAGEECYSLSLISCPQ